MKLCQEQIDAIFQQEQDEYIWELVHKFKKDSRLTLPEENINKLFNRLKVTYQYIIELGFSKKILIETFLCAEATTPGYKDNPKLKAWIEKQNETPENQFEDLLRIAKSIQQEK